MKWIACFLSLVACQEPGQVESVDIQDDLKSDTLAWGSAVLRYPDTSVAIHGIHGFLRDSLGDNLRSGSFGGGQDTMIDLNGDGRLDYLREYYGGSGFGVKNRVYVALAQGPEGNFDPCPQLNGLSNATFILDSAFVYGTYMGGGGGYGVKLRWQGLRLDTLVSIDVWVDQRGDGLTFHFSERDHVTGRTRDWTSDQADFPESFRYCDGERLMRDK